MQREKAGARVPGPVAVPGPLRLVRRVLSEDLARGAGVNGLFAGLNAALGLLAAVVAARHLGPAGVGTIALGIMLIEFMGVVDNLPTAGFMRDYSVKPTPDKVATALVLKAALGLGLTVVMAAASPLLAAALDVPLVVPLTFAFIPVASVVDSVAIMSYEARREMVRRNVPGTAENAAKLLLFTVVATLPLFDWTPVAAIAYATLGASVAGTLVGLVMIPTLNVRLFDAAKAREYVGFGMRTQFTGVLNRLVFWFDILLIDLLLGHATQGLYKTAYVVMSYLVLAAGVVGIQLFPAIAAAHGNDDREGVRRHLSLGLTYTLAIAVPIALLFIAFPGVLLGVFGPEFPEAAWMLRALAPVGLLAVAVLPFEALLPAVNRPDLSVRLAIAQVTTNVVLDLALIPLFGVAGAIVASGCTFLVGLAVAIGMTRALRIPLPTLRDVRAVLGRGG